MRFELEILGKDQVESESNFKQIDQELSAAEQINSHVFVAQSGLEPLVKMMLSSEESQLGDLRLVPATAGRFDLIVDDAKTRKRIFENGEEIGFGEIRFFGREPNAVVFLDFQLNGTIYTIRPITFHTPPKFGPPPGFALIEWNRDWVDCSGGNPMRQGLLTRMFDAFRAVFLPSSVTLEYLVAFTATTSAVFGDDEVAATQFAQGLIDSVQAAFNNSGLTDLSANLKKVVLTDYVESGNGGTDLAELVNPAGQLADVHAECSGVHIVALANAPSTVHGKFDGNFFVFDYRRELEGTFAHETGHVLGGCHDGLANCSYDYCKGLCVDPQSDYLPVPESPIDKWRSLMSVNSGCGARKNLFIYPGAAVDGFSVQTGQNVAKCLNDNAKTLKTCS